MPNRQSRVAYELHLPYPHQGQQIVRRQMRRHNLLDAGRRWRKTTLGVSIACEDIVDGKHDLWTAPTFDQVRIAWSEMKKAAGGVFAFNHTQMYAELPETGGKCYFRSLDNPDNARGHTVTGRVFMDEAPFVEESAWYEILRPMLIDSGAGSFFMFTPRGRNWTWREWVQAHDRADSMAWTAPTLGAEIIDGQLVRMPHPLENPDIPFAELQDMFKTTPERTFRQEILAEFLENAGGVFKDVENVVSGELPRNPQPDLYGSHQYVMGVDLAKHADYTVIVIIDLLTHRVVDFHRFNLASWPLQKARIAMIAQYWKNAPIWMDATGVGDPIYDDLDRIEGLRVNPYKFTQASKKALIDHAVICIEQRLVSMPRISVLISELQAYEYERLPAGALRMNAPSGMHDDAVIAFALACWGIQAMSATSLIGTDIMNFIVPWGEGGGNFGGETLWKRTL